MNQSTRIAYLFNRYAAGSCTNAERDEYLEIVKSGEFETELQQLIATAVEQAEVGESLSNEEADSMLQEILHPSIAPVIPISHARRNRRILWIAASLLLVIGAGVWFGLIRTPLSDLATTNQTNKPVISDVAPGGNKAILTLADNSTIVLDSAANGQLAQQGSSVVSKTKDGELRYEVGSQKSEITYNMLSTPRGGQYQLVLPDGSKVWLNAASSIRYPTAFTGNERRVDIKGEAYFEVAKNPKKPFRVHFAGGIEGNIEVLGTHFNVNAYEDEALVKTTLLEGFVKVTRDAASAIIKPGEQAQLNKSGGIKVQKDTDVDEAIAWKNGRFYFTGADIQTIMRQVARWYDVDIVYEGKIPEGHYNGKPSRNLTASEMLKIVEYSGVKFTIVGKKIIVKE